MTIDSSGTGRTSHAPHQLSELLVAWSSEEGSRHRGGLPAGPQGLVPSAMAHLGGAEAGAGGALFAGGARGRHSCQRIVVLKGSALGSAFWEGAAGSALNLGGPPLFSPGAFVDRTGGGSQVRMAGPYRPSVPCGAD